MTVIMQKKVALPVVKDAPVPRPLPRLPMLDATTLPQHVPVPRRHDTSRYREHARPVRATSMLASEMRELATSLGADDVGFVPVDRDDMRAMRADVEALLPDAVTVIAFVRRMHREQVRSPLRSTSNHEFHTSVHDANDVGLALAHAIERRGGRALSPPSGFPMEMDRFPGRAWTISMKPIAVAAGLGQMGIHRNVIHPRFGNFITLGLVLTDLAVDEVDVPIDFNPCLGCRLCVAACPVGAIKTDGAFDFAACNTHNYREFMGGFTDWVETVVDSDDRHAYRDAVRPSETASVWQSLAFGPNYKAAYCLAVCPAGEDVIGPYLDDKRAFMDTVVKPLVDKVEPVYVVAGGDAEAHLKAKFPHKEARIVGSGLLPVSIDAFVAASPLVFSAHAARDTTLVVHFEFHGETTLDVTYAIDHGKLTLEAGRVGRPDLVVRADAATWLGVLRGESSPVWAIARRKVRVEGPVRLLRTFQKCFPR